MPTPRKPKLKQYTVIGVYEDNYQRFAETYQATDVEHAEEQARNDSETRLIVAGVVLGKVTMAG